MAITDFGLAVAADDASNSPSGFIAGTPMYMAPEQALGVTLDQRADMFSLGSVLYLMCTGQPPFQATGTLGVLKRVVEDTPRPIREINAAVPDWLCDLIGRLHAKKPSDRFASAQELADQLAEQLEKMRLAGNDPAVGELKPAPVDEMPSRLHLRHGLTVGTAAALLLMLATALGFAEATGVTNLGSTVIRLIAPEGTLVVEVDDPRVSVKIDGSELVITGAGAKEIRLKPGRYQFEASKNGKLVRRELITVTNNRRQVVRVTQEAADADVRTAAQKETRPKETLPRVEGDLPPTFTNSIGMEFVLVPKGRSWLGGDHDKLGQEVQIPADFYLGKFEVTQEEWVKVMGENPSRFSRHHDLANVVKRIKDVELKRFPVEFVSWDECQKFVAKLNSLEPETGWVYRLPTEAQWEYACRGGPMSDQDDSAFDFYFAKPTNTLLPEQASFNGEGNPEVKMPSKVGSYEANALGLHDMHGNVWEWCADSYETKKRVYRGGSWLNTDEYSRAARFYANPPSHRDTLLGLRVARVPSK